MVIVTHRRIYQPATSVDRTLDQLAAWIESPWGGFAYRSSNPRSTSKKFVITTSVGSRSTARAKRKRSPSSVTS